MRTEPSSRRFWHILFVFTLLVLLASCQTADESPISTRLPSATQSVKTPPEPTALPTESVLSPDLSAEEERILSTLRKVDDYPLYTMTYFGSYISPIAGFDQQKWIESLVNSESEPAPAWACSLFAAFGDSEVMLFGRNFDWRFSPALLLFTDPEDGYASVSMVDIEYLGFGGALAGEVDSLSLVERSDLLVAPWLPFDGMNEQGLVVGMAAVPPGDMLLDPSKEVIDSLGVIREILDHASTTEEAVAILAKYNIDMGGGPPLHYLIADKDGRGVLVEFYQGEMKVITSETPWHSATNFLKSAYDESAEGVCWRHDELGRRLEDSGGKLSAGEAMDLLQSVSQANTQWSIVYDMNDGDVTVTMGRDYDIHHTFELE
jgi:hypothetical protein